MGQGLWITPYLRSKRPLFGSGQFDCVQRRRLASCRFRAHIRAMGKGWKFVGEFKRGRKASFAIECIVMLPDLKEAKSIARKKLVGADEITVTELSQAEIKALNLKEGDVRL